MSIGGSLTVPGNVSIGGTLTYEDVTNIDSVGLVTARSGVISPYADIDDFISELVPLEDRRASGAFRQQLAGHLSRKVFKIAMENCDFEASQ